ncbi:pentatricopeptide repeat-containing protein At1g25360 [Dendrobium catenatum]|uniref:Pentatricopeptide repeat-containing protein n=1 Tax=Dendrobium catenatum TaxID=906689 RepID=A0A2I0V788_9ASPA|nr:pentatricopeptide repeat-containing protein At1g25360 [Dendrobium catenatum]PKU59270.1 Pentatricopeptide repeat-containing protein [Dendrobium catenatum]
MRPTLLALHTTDVTAVASLYAGHLQLLASLTSRLRHSILLRRLRSLHAHILSSGFKPQNHILNRLIDLYSKHGDIPSALHLSDTSPRPDVVARTSLINAYSNAGDLLLARKLFVETPIGVRDTVFYNAMISGYSRASQGPQAVKVFRSMLLDGFIPDDYTFTGVLSAAAYIVNLELLQCQQLHGPTVKLGSELVVSVANALISLYGKCESFMAGIIARQVFDKMPERDELTWTTMVVGYVRRGDLFSARQVFDKMDDRFDVVWNAMISGYVHHGLFTDAFEIFRRMLCLKLPLDEFTYTSVLSACANAGLFGHGKSVHARIIRDGPCFDPKSALPVENVLVTLYSRCSKMELARKIFDGIIMKDSVSWNAILSGYVNLGQIDDARALFEEMPRDSQLPWMVMMSGLVQSGLSEEALKLFSRMRAENVKPCDYTYAGTFSACGDLGAMEHGRQLHGQLIRLGYESSISAGNALVTMYAKCGAIEEAHLVFLIMRNLDFVSWNSIIAAFAQHGHGNEAIELFEMMIKEGIHPDRLTFLTVLTACNHAGLVDEGFRYFESMQREYGISPGEDHYARLIDLLGRAGKIEEAKTVIHQMPFEAGPLIWESVLAGCRIHRNVDLAVYAADHLFNMIPQHHGSYVLLSNIYASFGRWEDVAKVRKLMKDRGVKKEPGCSWIEVENKVHVFLVNDLSHPEVHKAYRFLEVLGAKMRKLGYVPDTRYVLQDVESERKEYVLSTHSEKLALAFGLLKLKAGAKIRILKNLRICGDCHSAIMFISLATGRDIVVRDAKRFHHFKDGECSCGNYW